MTALAGLRPLVKLAMRRDRIMLPVWVYVLTILVVSSAYSYRKLYPTAAGREHFAANATANPSLAFMYGPVFGHSVGSLTAWKPGVFTTVFAALMSIFLVIRHTRADEEAGRLELVGSTTVGRQAPLASGLLVAAVANAVLGLLLAVALIVLGQPAVGSFALALATAGCGLVFAGVAAVTAQLAGGARAARGLAIGAVALCYLLRAFADSVGASGPQWLTWLSPVGWSQQVRPFAGDRWWLVVAEFGLAGFAVGAAWLLAARRDLGAGLLPVRTGAPRAGSLLRGPLALAWRLERGALLGWAVGFVVLGVAAGAAAKGVGSLLGGSQQLRHGITRLGGSGELTDAYLAAVMLIAGIIAAGYATSALLRLRSQENAELAEPLLATTAGRVRWGLSHVSVAAFGTAGLLACAGLGAGVGYGVRGGDVGGRVPWLLGAAMAQLPAALAVAGVAVVAFGLRPGWSAACGWGALTLAGALVLFGPALSLGQWALDISPFTHLPKLPGASVSAPPLVWLSAIAAAMGVTGLAGLRRRDIG